MREQMARAEQILTNVLVNALRYTSAPGRIEVSVSRERTAVAFRIADSGIGLAPDQLSHIFERFYRVDKSRARIWRIRHRSDDRPIAGAGNGRRDPG